MAPASSVIEAAGLAQPTRSSARKRVAVLGGGLLGMVLALRLSQRGFAVSVLDAAPAPGGLADAQTIGGYEWDRFYHVLLMSDLNTRALVDELGLTDRLRWGRTRTGFFSDGRLHSMSNTVEFLRFPPLSLIQKLRLGGTIFLASRLTDVHRLEQQLAVDWLGRWSGARVLDRIWLPLLRSKLGDNYRIASAAFIWAIISRMYAARRSGLKEEMFGYLDGGYAAVLQALSQRLRDSGVDCLSGVAAERITDGGDHVEVTLADGGSLSFDRLVATVPTPVVARLCPQLEAGERERLEGVQYQGIVCGALLTKTPLSPYYVTNITDPGIALTGVIEMTALVDRERFGGHSLVYLPRYLAQDDPAWSQSDEVFRQQALDTLQRMYPHFRADDVIDFKVARARHVLAISTLDYTARAMPPMVTSLRNVSLLNSAQIAQGTLNVNETLGVVGERLADLVARLEEPAR